MFWVFGNFFLLFLFIIKKTEMENKQNDEQKQKLIRSNDWLISWNKYLLTLTKVKIKKRKLS